MALSFTNTLPSLAGRVALRQASSAPQLWRGLLGLWLPAIERAGDVLLDWSGYQTHGALTNMDAGMDYVPSPLGLALDFDGSNDYVALNTTQAARLETATGLTVFGVLRLNATQAARNLINRAGSGGSPSGWGIGVSDSSSNKLKFYTATSGGTAHNLDGTTALNANEWYSAAWTYFPAGSGTNKFIYLNGRQDASAATTVTLGYTSCSSAIGRYEGGASQYLNGSVAVVAVWNRALGPGEIWLLHQDPLCLARSRPRRAIAPIAAAPPTGTETLPRRRSARCDQDEPIAWRVW